MFLASSILFLPQGMYGMQVWREIQFSTPKDHLFTTKLLDIVALHIPQRLSFFGSCIYIIYIYINRDVYTHINSPMQVLCRFKYFIQSGL